MRKFCLTLSHHQDRKISGINRRVANTGKNYRHAANMIQMSVRDDKRAYFIFTFLQISCIRDHIVHSRRLLVREMHPCVNHDNIIPDFYRGHIFTDFFHPAEWDYPDYPPLWFWNFSATLVVILIFFHKRMLAPPRSAVSLFGILISGAFNQALSVSSLMLPACQLASGCFLSYRRILFILNTHRAER